MYELVESKNCFNMSDLPEIIIDLWSRYLREQYDIVFEDFWVDDDYGINDGDSLDYHLWKWTCNGQSYLLYDINTWPGDNADGTIYLEYHGKMCRIYDNGDSMLYIHEPSQIDNPNLTRDILDGLEKLYEQREAHI